MRSKTIARTQRRKRVNTLFQWPNSGGRSRQGNPARARHSTASRNSRLSFAVTPRSDFLPGNRASIFAQTVSLRTNLSRSINHHSAKKRDGITAQDRKNPRNCQQALVAPAFRAPKCPVVQPSAIVGSGNCRQRSYTGQSTSMSRVRCQGGRYMTIIYVHGVKVRSPNHGSELGKSFVRWLGPKLSVNNA